jgi:hypothetical protein
MMRLLAYDLFPAFAAMAVVTAAYAWMGQTEWPRPGGLVGHSLGIVGLALMLFAQVGYTLRRRVRGIHVGRMSLWLQAHIFAGLVGSYLALLHSAGKFHGVAGMLAGLTVAIVLSGFMGRYLYTAVPRTLDGAEIGAHELLADCLAAENQLAALGVPPTDPILGAEPPHAGWVLVFGRAIFKWQHRRQFRQAVAHLPASYQPQADQIQHLLEDRYGLLLEVHTLAATRRLLALWHVFHVPLGIVLFTLAAVHVGGALYYSTWLK